MRDAEAVQARREQEKDRVKAAANVTRRVSSWAGRKTLPQLLRSVHILLPTLVPAQVGVATDGGGGGVKSVRSMQYCYCFHNLAGMGIVCTSCDSCAIVFFLLQVRRLYHAVLRRIHPDKLSRTNSS